MFSGANVLEIILSKNEARRIKTGHPWVFSNEIAAVRGEKEPGARAEVFDAGGGYLGTGYYNPRSLIAVRLLSRQQEEIDDPAFFRERLAAALRLRQALYPDWATFRLVHGEGDFLPGLVVDKYGEYLAIQFLTYGMEVRRGMVLDALVELLAPRGIIARNDVAFRELEGLAQSVEVLVGEVPARVAIEEHGLRLWVDLYKGQKTGHFLDQKENHLLLAGLSPDREVLDCFSYSGAWGLHAAAYGARSVRCLDISARAIDLVRENAAANSLTEKIAVEQTDVFDRLRNLKAEGRRFDLVILDPPAFVKSRKNLAEAERGYLTINRRAMELLRPGGHLITCSCSHLLSAAHFREILVTAANLSRRQMRLITIRSQAPDHPVLLSIPETEYLKCVVLQAV